MSKLIVIASGKGGTGKTTSAINLGAAINQFGKDVLVNIEKNKQDKVFIPVLDDNGTIEYLGDKFKLQEVVYDI